MSPTIDFPTPEEYAAFQDDYVQRVRDGDIFAILARQPGEIREIVGKLSDQQALFRPAPEEWSIKEVIGHISDTERILYYRALCISRGETQSLPGFDQDQYTPAGNFDAYSLDELINEFALTRQANLISLKHLSTEASLRRGVAFGNVISVRALIHIMAGHVYHHVASLQTVYLPAL